MAILQWQTQLTPSPFLYLPESFLPLIDIEVIMVKASRLSHFEQVEHRHSLLMRYLLPVSLTTSAKVPYGAPPPSVPDPTLFLAN